MDEIIENTPNGQQYLNIFFEAHHRRLKSITRVDERGIIIYTVPYTNSIGNNISNQRHVQEILKEHKPVVNDHLKQYIEEVNKAVEKASALTRRLLAFSRHQTMEMNIIDLNSLIRNIQLMISRIIGEDIELTTLLAEQLWKVKVDPAQMEQVIINIVVNARDAMPEGGKLTIETANVEFDRAYASKHFDVQTGRYVLLAISDTGIGMTEEIKEKIFEPFFTTKQPGKGTGLGLSTAYGIVKQSGGNIQVDSKPCKGTTFKIYLPAADELSEQSEKTITMSDKETNGSIRGGNETVLIVEDDENVRRFVTRVLTNLGYKVLEAENGKSALMLCGKYKEHIHLVMADLIMPEMGGPKLVEMLKTIHPEIEILYMSGYPNDMIVNSGILLDGKEFVQKPFTVVDIARRVRKILDKGKGDNS